MTCLTFGSRFPGVAFAASLFDSDGIQVRFMNSQVDGNGIRNSKDATDLVQRVRFSGLTPLGTSMDRKILQPLVLGPARANALQKPVLILTVTDGAPAGEDRYAIVKVLVNATRELARTRYGPDAISFQFAQVGQDQKAQDFLAELDNHPEIGGMVDVTSNVSPSQSTVGAVDPCHYHRPMGKALRSWQDPLQVLVSLTGHDC